MPAKSDSRPTVVLTDHPWPDVAIETEIFAQANIDLVAGPVTAPAPEEVERMIADANPQAIMTCWAQVSAQAISNPTRLTIVTRLGIGLDNIAVQAATDRGAWVSNVPDYCVGEVSDHAIALLLAYSRGISVFDRATKAGEWSPDKADLRRTADLIVGLIGYGRIARETARKLASFGCTVLGQSRSFQGDEFAQAATHERIQAECDAIVIHAPLTAETHHLVDRDFLKACRRTPLIINVSRGSLVDNDALLAALAEGWISGAALDVIEGEPSPPSELLKDPRIIATPHVAFSSTASLVELRRRACEDVVRALQGEKPAHPCNEPGTALEGGVASDIRVIDEGYGPIVIKHALSKLRVKADWFSDPNRSNTEVAALEAAAELMGAAAVPKILWSDAEHNSFAMEFVGPPFTNWKGELLSGNVCPAVAAQAGRILARMHRNSAGRDDIRGRFDDVTNFEELRIEPFFARTAASCPEIADDIVSAAEGMRKRREALVHGDYSPKNLLTDGQDIVVLDWEVAHWGDPRFDIAFCLSHLILKAHRRGADHYAFIEAASAFADAYRSENPGPWDRDLVTLVGCLMTTRLFGPSPIDYLDQIDVLATAMLAKELVRGNANARSLPFFANLENVDA